MDQPKPEKQTYTDVETASEKSERKEKERNPWDIIQSNIHKVEVANSLILFVGMVYAGVKEVRN